MNVMGQGDIPGNHRGRGRGRGRGKAGTLQYTQKPVNLMPKYRIPETPRRIANPSTSATSRTPNRRSITSSSSARPTNPRVTHTDTSRGKSTTSASAYSDDHLLILAVTTGRGQAREEVGMAVIDLQYPNMILCQMSDETSYVNALTKIHIFQPVEILMPDTMGRDHQKPNSLYNKIKSRFPDIEITEISRTHWNATAGLERIKTHCFNQFSSIELIVNQKYYALSAVCVLFKYIESIQHIVYTQNSVKFEYQVAENATMIDLDSAHNLELVTSHGNKENFCLLGALNRCSTPAGRRLLRASILQPPCNENFIKERQDCVEELVSNKSLYAIIQPVIRRLYGTYRLLNFVTQPTKELQKTQVIANAERNLNYVLLLKTTLDIIPELKTALTTAESKYFKDTCRILEDESFDEMRQLILELIQPDVLSVNGFLSSNYQRCFAVKNRINDQLDVARQSFCEMIDDIESTVEALAQRHNLALNVACTANLGYHIEMKLPKAFNFDVKMLPDEFIEAHVRNGVVHMTTSDIFVRNQQTRDMCNEIHLASNNVLKEMFEEIKKQLGCLFTLNDRVAGIDVILSLAEISSIHGYVRPSFGASLEVKDGKHPVMDILGQESPTPNDIIASVPYNLHTISGPNMSGKTIYLKQIVLLQIMAQIGCFVPATSGQFRITDHIFCRIGVRDDIEFNASSFMLEMKEVQYILQLITPRSLVVLDELCRSTTVEEGASIAWAVCKKLLLSEAFTFQATHFEYLIKLANLYPNVTNHYFEAIPNAIDRPEEARLIYTHKLKKGTQKIKNYGLMLARATGLPEKILQDAQRIINSLNSEANDQQTPQNEDQQKSGAKIKRNYDKLVNIYEKMNENDGIEDEELYELVKGLESISYEESPPPPESSKTTEAKESSEVYTEGPKGTTTPDSNLSKSDSLKTITQKTEIFSSQGTECSKKLTKRPMPSPLPFEPKTKLPKRTDEPSPSAPARSPLKSINSAEIHKNSPFKIPRLPAHSKKYLTNDPESPLFIPRSLAFGELPKVASITSESSSISDNLSKSSRISPQVDRIIKKKGNNQDPCTLTQLQSLSPRPVSERKKKFLDGIPASCHHFFSSLKPENSSAHSLQNDWDFHNSSMNMHSKSRADFIASLPPAVRPVSDDCFFPDEFRHVRHLVKNLYREDDNNEHSTVQPNQYYFMSDVITISPSAHHDTDIDEDNDIQTEVRPLSSVELPPVPVIDPDLIVLSSGDEEEEEIVTSECSMSSLVARANIERKEHLIFKDIEEGTSEETEY